MKSGIPLYETIQEDWSSLHIGASKLDPMPPMVGGVDQQEAFTRIMTRVQWRPGDPIDLWILLPKGVTKPPVVLYLYDGNDGGVSATITGLNESRQAEQRRSLSFQRSPAPVSMIVP